MSIPATEPHSSSAPSVLDQRRRTRYQFDDNVFQLQASLLGPPRYSSLARCRLPVLGTAEEHILKHWEAEMNHRWFLEDVKEAVLRGSLGWERPHGMTGKSRWAI